MGERGARTATKAGSGGGPTTDLNLLDARFVAVPKGCPTVAQSDLEMLKVRPSLLPLQ